VVISLDLGAVTAALLVLLQARDQVQRRLAAQVVIRPISSKVSRDVVLIPLLHR